MANEKVWTPEQREAASAFEEWIAEVYPDMNIPGMEPQKSNMHAAYRTALRTRPEGEAKLTWRVDWLHDDGVTWMPCQPLQFDEETARVQILGESRFRLVKIETYETVVETRKN